MAHTDQIQFFQQAILFFPSEFSGKVIDIGANEINGGPHTYVKAAEYVGVDLAEGENVDLVARGEEVDLPTGYFDVAMSSECFEHAPTWRAILLNMIRMTRPGGVVIFSCATTGRPEHGTSRTDLGFAAPMAVSIGQEHYANVTAKQAREVLGEGLLDDYFLVVNDRMFDLYMVGLKRGATVADLQTLEKCRKAVENKYESLSSFQSKKEFAVHRGKRYLAKTVGDRNLERVRKRIY